MTNRCQALHSVVKLCTETEVGVSITAHFCALLTLARCRTHVPESMNPDYSPCKYCGSTRGCRSTPFRASECSWRARLERHEKEWASNYAALLEEYNELRIKHGLAPLGITHPNK